jgi:hypothetical protein
MRCIFYLFILGLVAAGCYQVHSDDDLRTIPATNNPHVIQDSNRNNAFPTSIR